MSNATATVVECPKCFGVGELRHFRNIHNGTCFLCAGAGTCTEQQASRWLAAQIRGDLRGGATQPAQPAPPSRPTKVVELPGFGRVEIRRVDGDTDFVAMVPSQHGPLTAWFDVRGGRVLVSMVVNGLVRRQGELQAALQGALKR